MPAGVVLAQPLRGHLGTPSVHREDEPATLLTTQMNDVRAQEHRGNGRRPQEAESAHRRDDRAEREGHEEHRGRTPPARQDLRPATPLALRLRAGGASAPCLGRRAVLLGPVGCRVVQPYFRMCRRRGKGPDVDGLHTVRDGIRVHVARRLLGIPLPQLLGITALHGRPSGQQPDGGAEAFRRTRLIELVLPAEPHRHQVGGPCTDDDCVDEAAAAHAHTVEGFARQHPPIGPVCRTIRLI